jgi:hypothetical protein
VTPTVGQVTIFETSPETGIFKAVNKLASQATQVVASDL